MKQRRTRNLFLTLVIVGFVMIVGFFFRPHSFERVLDTEHDVSSMACSMAIPGIKETDDQVNPEVEHYCFELIAKGDAHFDKIMEILEESEYRMSIRNLLPWETKSLDGPDDGSGSITIALVCGDDEARSIFMNKDWVWISKKDTDGRSQIYKFVNLDAFYELEAYIKANGEKSE